MARVTQAEFARQIKKTKQYVGKRVKDGTIKRDADGLIDPDEARAALRLSSDPARVMAAENADGSDDVDQKDKGGGTDYSRAATAHKEVQAKLADLEYQKRAGLVVSKADVDHEAFEAARAVRDRLMTLPQELAGALVGMTDEMEIKMFLRNKIRDALIETAINVDAGS